MRNIDRPTVSKTRARAPTAMVSSGRFSVMIWATNCNPISAGTFSTQHLSSLVATHRRSRASHEHQSAQVRRTLVAQRARGIEQRTDTVRLDGRADERSAPGGAGVGGLLGLEELLLGVGGLGLAVGLAEDGAEDGERGGVVEDGADRDGGGLDGREVWLQEGLVGVHFGRVFASSSGWSKQCLG